MTLEILTKENSCLLENERGNHVNFMGVKSLKINLGLTKGKLIIVTLSIVFIIDIFLTVETTNLKLRLLKHEIERILDT